MKLWFLLVSVFICLALPGQTEIPLYDGPAPGSEGWTWQEQTGAIPNSDDRVLYNVTTPTLTAYLPEAGKATGTAMIVAPGGAFHFLSIDNEGHKVARWLQSLGVAAFVLKYRTVRMETEDPFATVIGKMGDIEQLDRDNAPLIPLAVQDGLTAVAYVRENAARYGVATDRIGMIGFSAGGTLTASVGYTGEGEQRPDFIAPIYPYEKAILGSEVPEQEMPIFLAVAGDDQLGFTSHSINLYEKWYAAGQPAQLHIYETGGHGFGMSRSGKAADYWNRDLQHWLTLQKLLIPASRAEQMTEQDLVGHLNWHDSFNERLQNDFGWSARYRAQNEALPESSADRVVFIGNSITEGWYQQDSAWFQEHNFIGRGISGQTSPQLLVRFRQDVIDLDPAAVVILIGTNDVAQNTGYITTEQTVGNIKSMVDLARANGIVPIVASVLPAYDFPWRPGLEPADKILRINEQLRAYAGEKKLVYLDFHSAMKDDRNGLPKELAGDGVHPTLQGYREYMEPLALEAIRKALGR